LSTQQYFEEKMREEKMKIKEQLFRKIQNPENKSSYRP
jgi:hypothetical protein